MARRCNTLLILLESCGFRPQNLQGSDFSREKSAPVVAVHAAGHDWNSSGPKPSRALPAFFDRLRQRQKALALSRLLPLKGLRNVAFYVP